MIERAAQPEPPDQASPPTDPRGGRAALPLRYRLPNPPPLLVGRASELEALTAAIQRFPIAVLCGPGGVGKTALALYGLARLPGFAAERALLIELRSGLPVEDPRLQIIRGLAQAQGVARFDWTETLRDDDAIGGALIDLAEAGPWWILLDDLHHVPTPAATALLGLLGRYARRSRWIVTSRAAPRVLELAPQIVMLSGLPDPALRALAAACAPDLPEGELQRAVAAAGGSPWMLQQVVMAPDAGAGEDRLLGGLPEGARAFLGSLASVDRALPLDVLGSFTALPVAEVIGALEQRGLLQRSHEGYRLHDVVRRILRAAAEQGQALPSPLSAGRPLATQADPAASLEGLRLLILSDALDEVLSTLERCGAQLLDLGHAPRLWQLLQMAEDRRLIPWRLRVAVALAQPALLAGLDAPVGSEPLVHRLLWARGLLVQGRIDAALDLATALRAEALRGGEAALGGEVGLVAVEALVMRERYGEANAAIEALPPAPDAAARATRESWAVYCLAAEGRGEEAARRVTRLWAEREALPAGVWVQVMINLARAFAVMVRLREAYEASGAVVATAMPSARALGTHFVHAMATGRFDEAGRILDRLEPFRPEGSPLRGLQSLCRIYHRLQVGSLAGLEAAIAASKAELQRFGELTRLRVLLRHEGDLRMLRAAPPIALSGEDLLGAPTLWSALHRVRWQVRAGDPLPAWLSEREGGAVVASGDPAAAPSPRATQGEAANPLAERIFAEQMDAEALLIQGDAARALETCARALQAAESCGWALAEVQLRMLRCEALLALGRWQELALATDALAHMAREMGSALCASDARFFGAFPPTQPVDWCLLEQLSREEEVAPVTARRARFLLGEDAPLDALDRQILAALQRVRGLARATTLLPTGRRTQEARPPDASAWGLADEGSRVWLPSGAVLSLADKPQLWSVLVSLYDRGGAATKDQLVHDVWGIAAYHPLQHDNRLHVAIRKLRRLLEEDPSLPVRLVTTADGYALVGPVRRALDR